MNRIHREVVVYVFSFFILFFSSLEKHNVYNHSVFFVNYRLDTTLIYVEEFRRRFQLKIRLTLIFFFHFFFLIFQHFFFYYEIRFDYRRVIEIVRKNFKAFNMYVKKENNFSIDLTYRKGKV